MTPPSTPADVLAYFAELEELAAGADLPVTTVAYGSLPEQVADLRVPAGGGRAPVAMLLHGGFWRAISTRRRMDALAVDLVSRGWATWNVEYRRVGTGGGFPRSVEDAVAALLHLRAAGLTAVDASRVVVIGHSAGGYLALQVAGRVPVETVVALGAVTDLVEAAGLPVGAGDVHAFVGGTPADAPGAYAAADPGVGLPSGARFLLVHGELDERVPIGQSRRYAERVLAAGDHCRLLELPGVDHFSPVDPRSAAWAEVMAALGPPPA